MRPYGSPQELERRRFRAIELFKEGYQPVEIARMVGADRRTVRHWNAVYRKRGKKALKAKPACGRTPKLDAKAKMRLTKILLKGAKAAGFPTDLWTCPRVAQVIRSRFGVEYHVDHVVRILHSLGFSPQKPERRAIERDEDGIKRWIKHKWPRIKKKPRS